MSGQRQSGILLHPTALPSPYACGDLGREAHLFVDFLARAGQHLWQVLPISPPGYGESPYSSLSAFAGNIGLISLEALAEQGELRREELPTSEPCQISSHVFKRTAMRHAAQRFYATADQKRLASFAAFCEQNRHWLNDYTLFVSLHEHFGHQAWQHWPEELRYRHPEVLQRWRDKLAEPIALERYAQFIFFEQWQRLKTYAHRHDIALFGDIPLLVAYDSADVWANPQAFQLDAQLQATSVAGVPPDYFSASGQRWGNPLYRWETMQKDGFSWWLQRLNWNLDIFDLLRFDHFRGLDACWSIPAAAETAMAGEWQKVPGRELLAALFAQRPDASLVAEDLGTITPEVETLRHDFALPGMKILQFAFDSDNANPYLPHNLSTDSVVYTGTHDNDTTLGWWSQLPPEAQQRVRTYLGYPCNDMPWDLITVAMQSCCQSCIFPLQDLLGLGSDARFNRPGVTAGNWRWRIPPDSLTPELAERTCRLTRRYRR